MGDTAETEAHEDTKAGGWALCWEASLASSWWTVSGSCLTAKNKIKQLCIFFRLRKVFRLSTLKSRKWKSALHLFAHRESSINKIKIVQAKSSSLVTLVFKLLISCRNTEPSDARPASVSAACHSQHDWTQNAPVSLLAGCYLPPSWVFWLTVGIRKQTRTTPKIIRTRAYSWFTNISRSWIGTRLGNNHWKWLERKNYTLISRHTEQVHHSQKDETLSRERVTAEEVNFFRHTHWGQRQNCIGNCINKINI